MRNNFICRTMYCPYCKARGSPHKDDIIILFGSTENILTANLLHYDPRFKKRGFTPHLLAPILITGNEIKYSKACGVVGCGMKMGRNPSMKDTQGKEEFEYSIVYLNEEIDWMPLKEWDALVDFKDHYYYLYLDD